MKIAFVLSGLNVGGGQTMAVKLIKGLDRTRYDVRVFVRGHRLHNAIEAELEGLGVPCEYLNIHVGGGMRYKAAAFLTFQKALDAYRPDILHVHLESIYAYVYAILHRKKLIVTIHNWPDHLIGTRFRTFARALGGRVWLVGCAACVTERAKALFPEARHFTTIHNPIEPVPYAPHGPRESGTFQWIHVARLTTFKNQALLLHAFAMVHRRRPATRLLIVGDGELREALQSLCQALGLGRAVAFLGNRDDIPALLADSDAFVMSSDSECCPMAVLEAMAGGLPIVSTDVGGIREIAGDAGLYAEKGDADALAQAMLRLVDDGEQRLRLSACARVRSERFHLARVAGQYEALYDRVHQS